MSIIITILFIAIILFQSVRRLLPSTTVDIDEPDRGYTPNEILKETANPQPQPVNINKNPVNKQEINPQIIEQLPTDNTFNNEDLRKAIIMSEILNRKNI